MFSPCLIRVTSWQGEADETTTSLLVPLLTKIIVANALLFVLHCLFRARKRQSIKRKWSFTSLSMIEGVLPPRVHAPETIINVALYFRGDCPSVEDMAEMAIRPLLEYERLSTIPDLRLKSGRPLDSPIQPLDMVRQIEVHGDDKVTNEAIVAHCQDSFSQRLESKPWWEFLVIKNNGPGLSACVFRMHHGLGDGMSLVYVFSRIITDEKGDSLDIDSFTSTRRSGKRLHRTNPIFWLFRSLQELLQVLTLGMTRYDDDTVFSRGNHAAMVYSGRRSTVILPPIDLEFCKQLRAAANVTVNDILMTAVSQTIHDYCKSQNCHALETRKSSIQCRSLLGVSLPRPTNEWKDKSKVFRNHFSMTSIDLGVGIDDMVDRLNFIHNRTMNLKTSPRVQVQHLIQNTIAPLIPTPIFANIIFDIFSRHSVGYTNVAGPASCCNLAGRRIDGVQAFLPSILPIVAIVSYAGTVFGNILLDAEEFADSDSIATFYAGAFAQLGDRLGVQVPNDIRSFASGNKK